MKTVSFKLPESLDKRLTSAAGKRGESKSALVREAIETFISGDNNVSKGSCLELAKDLVGCVKGPLDLSFNKKRMRGYGQ